MADGVRFLPINLADSKEMLTFATSYIGCKMTDGLSKKDKKELYGRFSKYMEDISKLVLAGVVIAAIMKQDIDVWWLVSCGTLVAIITLYAAYKAYVISKKQN